MDSQTIKLVKMMSYEKKKIEPKLKHNFLNLTVHFGAILNNKKYKLIDQ